jgi:hypothetical protein
VLVNESACNEMKVIDKSKKIERKKYLKGNLQELKVLGKVNCMN